MAEIVQKVHYNHFFTFRRITEKLFAKMLLDRLFELFMFDLESWKLVFDWTLRKKYECFNVVYISFPVLTNILNIYKKRVQCQDMTWRRFWNFDIKHDFSEKMHFLHRTRFDCVHSTLSFSCKLRTFDTKKTTRR